MSGSLDRLGPPTCTPCSVPRSGPGLLHGAQLQQDGQPGMDGAWARLGPLEELHHHLHRPEPRGYRAGTGRHSRAVTARMVVCDPWGSTHTPHPKPNVPKLGQKSVSWTSQPQDYFQDGVMIPHPQGGGHKNNSYETFQNKTHKNQKF